MKDRDIVLHTGLAGYVNIHDWMRQFIGEKPMTEKEKHQMRLDIVQDEENKKLTMEFNIKNKEVQNYLESLSWIHHYSGNGTGTTARFCVYDPSVEDKKLWEKCETTGFPKYSEEQGYPQIDINKESYATYSMPIVHISICEQSHDFPMSFEVHFAHLRTGDDYERVFMGYAKDVEEIKSIFRSLGIAENYINEG